MPAHVLYQNDKHGLMAMLSPKPVVMGHTLVVPREAVDHWHDLEAGRAAMAMVLGQIVAKRLTAVLDPPPTRVDLHIMGWRVPHTHLKVVPSYIKGDTQAVYEFCSNPRPAVGEEDLLAMQQQLAFPDEIALQTDDLLARWDEPPTDN